MFWTLSNIKTSYFTSPNDAGIQKHTLFTRFHAFEGPRTIVDRIWPPWAALGPPGVPSGAALGSPWDVLEPPWAPSGAVGASWVASGGLSGPSKDENQAVRNHGPKGTSRPLRPETPGARCLTASVPTGVHIYRQSRDPKGRRLGSTENGHKRASPMIRAARDPAH